MNDKRQLTIGDRFCLTDGKATPPISAGVQSTIRAELADAKAVLGQKFKVVAYSGKPIAQYWSDIPLVIDIAASTVSKVFPILQHHSTMMIIGHSTGFESPANKSLAFNCVVSVPTGAAVEFVEGAKAGFPWRASVGASVISRTDVKAGEMVTVNGRQFNGPIVVVGANFYETSVLPLPADDETSAALV